MTTLIIIGIAILYVANFFLNRWIYFQIQKQNKNLYPNPTAVFICFCSLFGTLILLLVFISECNKFKGFFKYKE